MAKAKRARTATGQFVKTRKSNKGRTVLMPKKPHYRRPKLTVPISIVAGLLPGLILTANAFTTHGLSQGAATEIGRTWLGYDAQQRKFFPHLLWRAVWPLAIGFAVHRAATMLGVNRMLAQARIPILRI